MTCGETVFIGIGSNLGDRALNLKRAVTMLGKRPSITVKAVSGIYETDPVEEVGGGPFLNAVLSISTALEPAELLRSLHGIEEAMGRVRTPGVASARVIDLDILLFGNLLMDTAALTIPHPRLRSRRFALEPLCELAPLLKIPGTDRTIGEMARKVKQKHAEQGIRFLGPMYGKGMP